MQRNLLRIGCSILLLIGPALLVSAVPAFDHNHSLFTNLLQASVVTKGPQSLVRYDLLKKDPSVLDAYLAAIETVTEGEFRTWDNDRQLAFLINAYNAFTLKLILTRYPDLESIKELGGFFSGPWKLKFFTLFGTASYLDYIEHELIRKHYPEPRIHFALVCASISCPPLKPQAYLAESLDQQLAEATRSFLQDPERNRFDPNRNRLYLSSLFKWYRSDFEKSAGTLTAFVAPWITDDPATRNRIANDNPTLEFLDYDWSLNRARE